MKIALIEHFTSLGDRARRSDPVKEGRVMRDAVVSDLKRLQGVEVIVVDRRERLGAALRAASAVLVIAPETDGVLERLSRIVERRGLLLLGASSSGVRLAADKLATIRRLQADGLPVPRTESLPFASARRRLAKVPPPFVLKPRDGCGCGGVVLVRRPSEIDRALRVARRSTRHADCLVQEFVAGEPVSVSFVVSDRCLDLGLNLQRLRWSRGRPAYLGGETFWPHSRSEKAVATARAAVDSLRALAGMRGYVGVDLILGRQGPVVIEVNPRLTTSYVGLRESIRDNLAGLIRRAALGLKLPERVTPVGRRSFEAGGTVVKAKPSGTDAWRITSAGTSAASI